MVDMSAIFDPDPLVPGVLPADLARFRISSDTASAPGVRPFGLTRTTVVPDEQVETISGFHYDPVRQTTVDDHGIPVIHAADKRHQTNCDN